LFEVENEQRVISITYHVEKVLRLLDAIAAGCEVVSAQSSPAVMALALLV
jgi:hypothetical protein